MPKRKRSSSKKRVSTRKRSRVKRRVRRPLPRAFPKSMTTVLKYVQTVTLDAGASGVPAQYNFRANSIYDPDLTGTGGQPMGRDQFEIIYDHYTVIGARMKVKFFTTGDYKQNVAMWVGGRLQDAASTYSNLPYLLEQPGTKGKMMMTGTYDGRQTTDLTLKYSPKKMFKLGKGSVVGNTRICAQQGANPVEDAIFSIIAVQPDGSTVDPVPISALVQIEYIVCFTEQRPLNRS